VTTGRGVGVPPLVALTALPAGCRSAEERIDGLALLFGRRGVQEMKVQLRSLG
jgi:hypothetical protein